MNNKKAFSLIELSIVILIIGTLIAGISKASDILNFASKKIVQRLTKQSPVNAMPGLLMWLETSLDESFSSEDRVDGAAIDQWNDLKSAITHGAPYDLTQGTGSNQPLYIKDAFGRGIAAVRFDGINDAIYNGDVDINSNAISYFVVARRITHAVNDTSNLNFRNSSTGSD